MNYIYKTIILTAIFVAVIYIFMFRRRRQLKNKTFDSIKEYHDTYLAAREGKRHKRNGQDQNKYVTKYNSTEDYRDKDDINLLL